MDIVEKNRQLVARLTAKQRQCLHLVVLRKSSKEIAQILRISKPAVDQRLLRAKKILGATTRREAALIFASAAGDYDWILCDPAYAQRDPQFEAVEYQQGCLDGPFLLKEASAPYVANSPMAIDERRQNLKQFSVKVEAAQRISIMIGLTIGILAIVMAGLTIFQSLSGLLIQ